MADEYKKKGNQAFKKGKIQASKDFYSKAIELDGTNHIYYANRAAASLLLKKWEEAREDCKKCIELEKNFAKIYLRLAVAEKNLGNYEDALQALMIGMSVLENTKLNYTKISKEKAFDELKKIEKEIKGLMKQVTCKNKETIMPNPNNTYSKDANIDQKSKNMFNEQISVQYEMTSLTMQGNMMAQQYKEKSIVQKMIHSCSKQNYDIATYRRIGRAYVLQPCKTIANNLEVELKSLKKDMTNNTQMKSRCQEKIRDVQERFKDFQKTIMA